MRKQEIIIDSDSSKLQSVRHETDLFLRPCGFPDSVREQMIVAIGEAAANSIRHAYQGEKGREVRVSLEETADQVILKVRDFGKKIDLQKLREPELPPTRPNGLGIYFMKTIMDDVTYNTAHAEGNEVILVKSKPAAQKE